MYKFFIDGLELPVAPQKLTVKIKGNNKTLTLINESDINFLRTPGLTEITFDIMLPMLGRYAFANTYHQPDTYLKKFETLISSKKPFRFLVSRVSPSGRLLYDTNMNVSLESYTITEDATKGLDVMVSITLKQYVSYSTKLVTVIVPQPTCKPVLQQKKKRETSKIPKVKRYVVKRGDCLWNLAKRFYGSGAKYMKIYNANPHVVKGRSPNLLYVGEVLTIP